MTSFYASTFKKPIFLFLSLFFFLSSGYATTLSNNVDFGSESEANTTSDDISMLYDDLSSIQNVAKVYKVSDMLGSCSVFDGREGVFFARPDCHETHVAWKAGNDLYFTEFTDGTATLEGSIYNGDQIGAVNITITNQATGKGAVWGNVCYNGNLSDNYHYQDFSGTVTVDGTTYTVEDKGNDIVVGNGASQDSDRFGFAGWTEGTFGGCTEFFGHLEEIGAGGDCKDVVATGSDGKVTLTNIPAGAKIEISGPSTNWAQQVICEGGNCNPMEMVSNLTAGDYTITAQTFNPYCYTRITVTVTGGGGNGNPCDGQGGDSDGDGICDNQDNCDFTPNTDQADNDGDGIGNACDDTPNGGGNGNGDCNDVNATGSDGKVTINNIPTGAKIEISGPSTSWGQQLVCEGNCSAMEMVSNLAAGEYTITAQTFNPYCYTRITVTVTGGGNGNPCDGQGGDSDGDGICDNQDNCDFTANADQADNDGDGIGNVCDDTPNGGGNGGSDCNDVTATGSDGKVTINNIPAGAKIEISGPSTNWGQQLVCEGNCSAMEMVSDLAAGDYTITAQTFNPYCYTRITVTVTGGGNGNPCDGQGGDSDGDGICDNQDNCDFTPNADQADNDGDGIGNACDDTPNGGGNGGSDCNDVTATGSDGKVTINNIPTGAKIEISGPSTSWGQQLVCEGNCSAMEMVSNLAAGDYTITAQTFNPYCYTRITVTVTGGGNGNPCDGQGGDSDGDGICDNQDNCDFTPNTDQADNDGDGIGNVCDDTPNGGGNGGSDCNDVTATGSDGKVTLTNVPTGAKIEISGPSTGWGQEVVCDGDCSTMEMVSNLTAGDYTITAQTFNPYCYTRITVTVTGNGGAPCDNQGGDSDGDGVCDNQDNCVSTPNPDQADNDGDGIGNVCDDTPNGTPCANQGGDSDGDGVCDNQDNCVSTPNSDQADNDDDGIGNACDDTPNGCGEHIAKVYKVSDMTGSCSVFEGREGVFFARPNCNEIHVAWKAGSDLFFTEYTDGTAIIRGSIYNGNQVGTVNINVSSKGTGKGDVWGNACYNDNLSDNYHYEDFSGIVKINGITYTIGDKGNDIVVGNGASQASNQFGFAGWTEGTFGDCTEFFGNLEEVNRGGDSDGDGICDIQDNCVAMANPNQADTDGDGVGNVCDDTPNGCDENVAKVYQVSDMAGSCSVFEGREGVFFARPNCNETHVAWQAGADLFFTEYTDGSAVFRGSIYNGNQTGTVHITLSGKASGKGDVWGNACYNSNLSNNHHYNSFSGTITVGATAYTVEDKGNDIVVGDGASQASNQFGFAGWTEGTFGDCTEFFGNLQEVECYVASSRNADRLAFSAFKAAREVELQWATNTGFKNIYYEVEKSLDGISFETIQRVENTVITNELEAYNGIDPTPAFGDNYYRVKQVYVDGSFDYTGVQNIPFNIDLESLSMYPNPAQTELNFNLKSVAGKSTTIQIINSFGQVVQSTDLGKVESISVQLPLDNMANGFYQVLIQVEGQKPIAKKLIVEKMY